MLARPSLAFAPLLLCAFVPSARPLAAQEQPRVRPDVITERVPMYGRIEVFTTRRARFGVVVSPVAVQTDSLGALIQSVTPNGPADKAGIRSGDIILRLNGRALADGQSAPALLLSQIAAGINAGDSVQVLYQRGKDRRNTTLIAGDEPSWTYTQRDLPDVPGEDTRRLMETEPDFRLRVDAGPLRSVPYGIRTPMPRMFMMDSPLADLELAPVNPELGRYFGTADGVLVINVPPDSRLGLKPGDVVFSVDGRRVKLPAQLFRVLLSYDAGDSFKFAIMRMKKRETVTGSLQEPTAPPP